MTLAGSSGSLAEISKKGVKMATPLEGTAASRNELQRIHYTHDAMVDLIISRPMITREEIAKYFGYSPQWVRRVINCDAFLERLALRKSEIIDPAIAAGLEERFRDLALVSMEVLLNKLETTKEAKLAGQTLELSIKALGMGARQANVNVQNSFVVAMPGKAASEQAWADSYSSAPKIGARADFIDVPAPSLRITDLIEPGVPG